MERVVVPPRIRIWAKDGWYIYFDPYNFVWVRVNESGRLLLELFRKYLTTSQVVDYVANKFNLPREKADEGVKTFVDSTSSPAFCISMNTASAIDTIFRSSISRTTSTYTLPTTAI